MMFDMSSAWVRRFLPLIPRGSLPVLDLACGEGRHLRLLIGNAYRATGVDKRMVGLADLLGDSSLEFIQRDLEDAQQDGSDAPSATQPPGGASSSRPSLDRATTMPAMLNRAIAAQEADDSDGEEWD